jgi:DNA adenine methylase
LAGGYSIQAAEGRLTESSIQRILDFDSYEVDVQSLSFDQVIPYADGLLFCDPPYYLGKKSNLYGNNGEDHRGFDHDSLHRHLVDKNNWILCYNNDPHIREMYKEYKIVEPSWNYGMSKDKSSKEILILNI